MNQPRRWSTEELNKDCWRATLKLRMERLVEPLEDYLEAFDECRGYLEYLFETTIDLTELDETAIQLLSDPKLFRAVRCLLGPPISDDDLKTVSEVQSLTAAQVRSDPEAVQRILAAVRMGMDLRRFPWVREEREPTEAEKNAAILASSALMATLRVGTNRQNKGKKAHEGMVRGVLTGAGLVEMPKLKALTLTDAPAPGQFCADSFLGRRKAAFLVRLWDHRIMAIECKVSNSATNSVKRLNNDAAAKAEAWIKDFGTRQVVPAAVLSGVYKLHNLEDAQNRGLAIFWAHDLKALTEWIATTRT